ncbi:MAG TPA: efflux RND transporter permease subunit [Burkholderiales bacterium]|nr:efflux RND transporter permease subunit [Burkholderiales bacterium]
MKFTDLFIKRPVLATVVSLLILLLGMRSLDLMNVRQYPYTTNAIVTVSTVYTGASPDLVQGFITTPLETQIASADGIDYLESSSVQGLSTITAHIKLNYDPNIALTQITSKVNKVRNQLPPGSLDPTIDVSVGDTTAVMYLSFYSDILQSNQITDYLTRVVQPKLSAVSGVQQAQILGARTFAMRIWLKPDEMAARGITPSDVRNALAGNNYLAAVGKTKGEMISVNLNAQTDLHSVEEFKRLIVKQENGTIIRLQDVAVVDLGAESYDTSVSFNGENATFIGINVLPTANPLTVVKEIRRIFPDIESQFPEGLKARIPYDATKYINDSINEVVRTLVAALAIVVLVIYLFLGSVRSVIIPVAAMPLSMIGAAFLMLIMGFTINLLTLLAMVLAIGLVVDDAIIVVENINRHIEHGASPLKASLDGARELGGPVIAMTITLVAVYSPIAFIGGLTGSLFTEFALTLAGSVLISGVVALTLSPMMCSKLLRPHSNKRGFVHFLDVTFERLKNAYRGILHNTLNYLPVTMVFAAVVFSSCYFLFVSTKRELAPTEDQGIIIVQAIAAPNASLDQTARYTTGLTKIYQGFPEAANIFLLNGLGGGASASTTNSAISGMVLKPWSERERSQAQLLPLVQQKINGISGLQSVAFTRPPLPGAGAGLPIQFVIGSTEPPLQINAVSQELLQRARRSGLFAYADVDLKYDNPQIEIEIDRDKAASLGLDMQRVGADLASMLGGNYVNFFSIQGRSYKVIPQVRQRYRLNPNQLDQFHVRTASGELVALSTIVKLKNTVQPEQLKRFQQLNSATLSAVPAPGVTVGQALDYLKAQAQEIFPKSYNVDYAGQSRQYIQEGSALIVTFFFALIIIFLVLAAQFESFRDPVIILVSVPMSISGALIFLSIGAATINIYTEVGLITLIGLISKHGILIVQFANQLKEKAHFSKRQAIEEAASVRLRPVLMTTAAMVVGVIPLITASGAGAISRFDIGLVIATGMSIGTLFTLFVVPAMYLVLAREHHTEEKAHKTPDSIGALGASD